MSTMAHEIRRNKNMKNRIYLFAAALCFGTFVLLASTSYAQRAPAYAQKQTGVAKVEAISQQLGLTPQQKVKVLPILRDELPKVQAIKNDNSLSRVQKVQQIRAIHQQTDPQMKAILTPEQYQKLKAIRQQTIKEATQTLGR
jgi:Spy/CpxP family protein refolding chaperone